MEDAYNSVSLCGVYSHAVGQSAEFGQAWPVERLGQLLDFTARNQKGTPITETIVP